MMNHNWLICIVVSVFLGLVACSATPEQGMVSAARIASQPLQAEPERLIIREANIELEVDDVILSTELVKQEVADYSGFILSVNHSDVTSSHIEVKVPAAELNPFMNKLAALGDVKTKQISARDVTEQVMDIEARLTNLLRLRATYRELLSKANSVSDILSIEKELNRVQSEIDRIEGHRKSLINQVELSQISITLERKTIYGPIGYLGKGVFWVIEKLFVIR